MQVVSTHFLRGQSALITGAGNGIGCALASEIAAEGAAVFLVDVHAARLRSALEGLQRQGMDADGALIDLSVPGAGRMAVEQARASVGPLHMLVHSASPQRFESDHWNQVSFEVWEAMYRVNVGAGFEMARHLAHHMIHDGIAGRMLFLTSLHAATPRNLPHYSTSKAALLMLVKELARSLAAHRIRVNALTPGAIAAGGFQPGEGLAAKIPLGRMGHADEVAAMGLTLLIDRYSRYVTGAEVVVDGGLGLYNWFEPAS
jgi:3-oxoacyl-[acyl-carrier protein] reductase